MLRLEAAKDPAGDVFARIRFPPTAPGRDPSVRDKSNPQCAVSHSSVVDSLNGNTVCDASIAPSG
jgi:hypothetical protein